MRILFFLSPFLLLFGCTDTSIRSTKEPLTAIAKLDVNRYLGRWYEIASHPNRFQKGCVATSATYSLHANGEISVLNECLDKSLSGPPRSARGKAWAVDETKAKLKVSFFWPFRGNYWVIEIGSEYEYSVIGEPDGKYIWILSRTRKMDDRVYQGILERLKAKGYSVDAITRTLQPDN